MNYLIDQGKTFYWGTSEWSADQIMEAHGVSQRLSNLLVWILDLTDPQDLVGPLMEQPQYSLLHRTRVEKEYARLYKEIGLGKGNHVTYLYSNRNHYMVSSCWWTTYW